PASLSLPPPAPTAAPAALPTPPALSCTALSCASGSVLSTPLSPLHPAPPWLRPRYNFVAPALHDLPVIAILPALRLMPFSSIPPASPVPRLPSTSAAIPHSPHTAPPTPADHPLLLSHRRHTTCSTPC